MKLKNKRLIMLIIIIAIICGSCLAIAKIARNTNINTNTNEEITNTIVEEVEVTPTPTPEPIVEETVYATTLLNLRLTPEEDAEVLEELPTNTELIKIGLIDNQWAIIKWSETETYYVNNDYISTEKVVIKPKVQDTYSYQPIVPSYF